MRAVEQERAEEAGWHVRPVTADDHDRWRELYAAYARSYRDAQAERSVVRWTTADDDYRARGTYDQVAVRTSWVTYDMPPGRDGR